MAPSINGFGALKEELTNITSLNLIANAKSILEKILWALIAICGSLFIYDVVYIQLENWRTNPILATKEIKKLSDMPLPAVAFCHKGLVKYGPVERLANFIDPDKNVPKPILSIRNEFLKVQFQKVKDRIDRSDFCKWLSSLGKEEKAESIIIGHMTNAERKSAQKDCNVSFAFTTDLTSCVFKTVFIK